MTSLRSLLPGLLLLASGCHGVVTIVQPVEINGTIATADGNDRPVFLEAYQAWSGAGTPRYPLAFVDETVVDTPGDFQFTIELPIEDGEGLVLYGWQDPDGDAALCAPGSDEELTGLVVLSEDEVADVVEADLVLDIPCLGPTRLFP